MLIYVLANSDMEVLKWKFHCNEPTIDNNQNLSIITSDHVVLVLIILEYGEIKELICSPKLTFPLFYFYIKKCRVKHFPF